MPSYCFRLCLRSKSGFSKSVCSGILINNAKLSIFLQFHLYFYYNIAYTSFVNLYSFIGNDGTLGSLQIEDLHCHFLGIFFFFFFFFLHVWHIFLSYFGTLR